MNIVELIKNLILTQGAGWVLWLLVGLSVVVVVVGVERALYYRARSGNTELLAKTLESYLQSDSSDKQPLWPDAGRALGVRVIQAGLAIAEHGEGPASQAMQSRVALERELLEKRLTILGTIGNNAPFVGLLGTVIGVVHAFDELGRTGLADQQQSAAVMSGIAEALVATAVGLLVAIPAVAIYNYYQRWMTSLIASTEVLSRLLLAYVAVRQSSDPSAPEGGQPVAGNSPSGIPRAISPTAVGEVA